MTESIKLNKSFLQGRHKYRRRSVLGTSGGHNEAGDPGPHLPIKTRTAGKDWKAAGKDTQDVSQYPPWWVELGRGLCVPWSRRPPPPTATSYLHQPPATSHLHLPPPPPIVNHSSIMINNCSIIAQYPHTHIGGRARKRLMRTLRPFRMPI